MDESVIIRSGDLYVTPIVTEPLLATAYLRMMEEGTLPIVFHGGIPTIRDFLTEYMTAGRRVTSGCFRVLPGKHEPEFCGLGWVYGAISMGDYKRAETGMVFFKGQSVKSDNLKFGRLMLTLFFDKYEIDALISATPEPNKLAIRYGQKLGLRFIGPVPDYCLYEGKLVPGWISHISRTEWLERNKDLLDPK